MEEVRLQYFARIWGFPDAAAIDSNLRNFSPQFYEIVCEILRVMSTILNDVDTLEDKYKLKSPVGVPLGDAPGSNTSLRRAMSIPSNSDDVTASPIAVLERTAKPRIVKKSSSDVPVLTRGSWAISGASKFEGLVQELHEWNNDLLSFHPPINAETWNLGLTTALLDSPSSLVAEPAQLPGIIEASLEEGPRVLYETAMLRQYSLELEKRTLTPTKFVTDRELQLSRDAFELDKLESRAAGRAAEVRQFGTFKSSHGSTITVRSVQVEWKVVALDVKTEHKLISRFRIQIPHVCCIDRRRNHPAFKSSLAWESSRATSVNLDSSSKFPTIPAGRMPGRSRPSEPDCREDAF